MKELVQSWFDHWEAGTYEKIPVEDNFHHHSPFGTIQSKESYLKLVRANQEAFLGGKFTINDSIYEENRACVRYTVQNGDFSMEVTEWFYRGKSLIEKIHSYYNVGKVSYEESFEIPDNVKV